jgi:hypothetical protein
MKFTIVKGYYWSKELVIEHFSLAVYTENFPKIIQNNSQTKTSGFQFHSSFVAN